jgi:hypothetical protein
LPEVALAWRDARFAWVRKKRGQVETGVGEAVKVIVAEAVTEPLALLVAVSVSVSAVVSWSAMVQGSFTTHGFVPTNVPPDVLHVTVLLLTPVT